MPIAHYTQEIIDQLRAEGEACLYYDNWTTRTESRVRSRLTNAAARAGLSVTTQKLPGLDGRGRVCATVHIDDETTRVID